jgi:hypothetical protein
MGQDDDASTRGPSPATESWPSTGERAVPMPAASSATEGRAAGETGSSPPARPPATERWPSTGEREVTASSPAAAGSQAGAESSDTEEALAPPAAEARSAAEGIDAGRPAPSPATQAWPSTGEHAVASHGTQTHPGTNASETDDAALPPTETRVVSASPGEAAGSEAEVSEADGPRSSPAAVAWPGAEGLDAGGSSASVPHAWPGVGEGSASVPSEAVSGREEPAAESSSGAGFEGLDADGSSASVPRVLPGISEGSASAWPESASGREEPAAELSDSPSGPAAGPGSDAATFASPTRASGSGGEGPETDGPTAPWPGMAARPGPEVRDAGGVPAATPQVSSGTGEDAVAAGLGAAARSGRGDAESETPGSPPEAAAWPESGGSEADGSEADGHGEGGSGAAATRSSSTAGEGAVPAPPGSVAWSEGIGRDRGGPAAALPPGSSGGVAPGSSGGVTQESSGGVAPGSAGASESVVSEISASRSAVPEATSPPSAMPSPAVLPARRVADGSPDVSAAGGSADVFVGDEDHTIVDESAFGGDHTVVESGSFAGAALAADEGAAPAGGAVASDEGVSGDERGEDDDATVPDNGTTPAAGAPDDGAPGYGTRDDGAPGYGTRDDGAQDDSTAEDAGAGVRGDVTMMDPAGEPLNDATMLDPLDSPAGPGYSATYVDWIGGTRADSGSIPIVPPAPVTSGPRTRPPEVADDTAPPAPPQPPARPGPPIPVDHPGTRIMPGTMVGDLVGAAPMPDRPVDQIAPPPVPAPMPKVAEHFGIRFLSDADDAGELFGELRRRASTPGGTAPALLLVGDPHTGQRRLTRLIARTLADAGVGDGSVRTADGGELRGDHATTVETILRGKGPPLLFERLDRAVLDAADPTRVASAVVRARSSRTVLIATCEPDSYARMAESFPELAGAFEVFRLPDLSGVQARLALTHVLADERRVTINTSGLDVVRTDLSRLSGRGDLVGARLVEAYLDLAVGRHLDRAGAPRDRMVLAPVDFAGVAEEIEPALRPPRDVDGFLRGIEEMIGLEEVKRTVGGLVAEARLAAERATRGLPSGNPSRNLIFLGRPGTGKATVAGLIGGIYAALNLLDTGHLRVCGARDFAGEDTAAKVAAHVDEGIGGVLLIEDAHLLDRMPAAADELSRLMAERRDKFMVICTAPPDEMEGFLLANPGFRAEFGAIVEFREPTDRQLVQLFSRMAERDLYMLDEELRVELLDRFGGMRGYPAFAFADTVRRMFDQIVARQASRLGSAQVSAAAVARLTVRDLPASEGGRLLQELHPNRPRRSPGQTPG